MILISSVISLQMERDKEMFKVRDDHLLHFQGVLETQILST